MIPHVVMRITAESLIFNMIIYEVVRDILAVVGPLKETFAKIK